MSVTAYPVHVDATLEPRMSRWLWLVKWLLAIPHYVVLVFLWVAFVVVSIVAFVAILVTGRYPRGLFSFNVGVLRWTWRVSYYAYGALGTDRYPPFTLADVPDYPAHFDVDYPGQLSRGLALVKWWLLAIPHYLVVGIFAGGGTWALWQTTDRTAAAPGLIGLLVFVAAVVLLFTGRYPQQIFDFVLGMNRWGLRVAAYAALMTDDYPPFRLDMGGHEPGVVTVPPPPPPLQPLTAATQPPPTARAPRGWTGGRIASLVIGCLVGLLSLILLAAGGVATWATSSQRDSSGYLNSDRQTFSTAAYAVTSDEIDLGGSADRIAAADILGTLRIRVTPLTSGKAVFVGVAPQSAAQGYLARVDRLVVTDWSTGHHRQLLAGGQRPLIPPADANIWSARASGVGTQTLTWRPESGHWVVVVMNQDATAGVAVTATAGATMPDLAWIATGLLAAGALLLALAVVLVAVPVTRASR